jgi:hypothetical protein
MKVDPTTTNNQDDNEQPVRYLECQSGSKKRAGKWFRQHCHEADQKRLQCLSCGVHFPAQYTDWINETHIEQRFIGQF